MDFSTLTYDPWRICSSCKVGQLLTVPPWDVEGHAEMVAVFNDVLDDEDAARTECGYELEPREPRLHDFLRNAENLNPLRCVHCGAGYRDVSENVV